MSDNPLDIARQNRFGRVIYEDSLRAADYRAAREDVEDIRNRLSRLRWRLRDLQETETSMPHDSVALEAAGALSCVIMALYTLVEGNRSFKHRAELTDDLWTDIHAHPEKYVLRPTKETDGNRTKGHVREATTVSRSNSVAERAATVLDGERQATG